MESKAKLLGHSIHQMLIVLPLGLLVMAVVFDIIYLASGIHALPTVTYWDIAAGVITGLIAAVFGLIDWLAIPRGTRAKAIGMFHGLGNVVVVVLFAISWWLRRGEVGYSPSAVALVFSFAGVILGAVTGWLGGELVVRLGVGVDPGAYLDAPNSLFTPPPGEVEGSRVTPGTHRGISA